MTKILRMSQRHCAQVLAINAASRPAVAPLDTEELDRLRSFGTPR